ncbi:MAG TPA: hypothetical protein VGJ26_00440, partial [Pirellulales bacterium]
MQSTHWNLFIRLDEFTSIVGRAQPGKTAIFRPFFRSAPGLAEPSVTRHNSSVTQVLSPDREDSPWAIGSKKERRPPILLWPPTMEKRSSSR